MATLKIKQFKSKSGQTLRQKRTLEALGFSKLNQVIEVIDNAQIRGMIAKVNHLVAIQK